MLPEFTKHVDFDPELEQAVIGICLLERFAISRTVDMLEAKCFYVPKHEKMFAAIQYMHKKGLPVDCLTVVNWLAEKNKLDAVGGPYELTRCMNAVVSSAHLEYWCYLLRVMWVKRQIQNLSERMAFQDGDIFEKISGLQKELRDLQTVTQQDDWMDTSELMVRLYQKQDEMNRAGGVGITTGIKQLDKENGGFANGQMIVLGARPSVGKSALMGQMAIEIAKAGKRVGIVSLEMSNSEIAGRLAAIDANSDFKAIYRGLYRDEQEAQQVYRRLGESFSNLPIFVSDTTDANIDAIRNKAMRLQSRRGLECLMIDYLQLVPTQKNGNRTRENEVSEISRGCKLLAKELNVPLIVLSQLTRESAKRTGNNRYPQLWDLRESGSLEQDADVVMFLHRDWLMGETKNEHGQSTEHEADLLVRKWRNGTLCNVKLNFDGPKMKFSERGRIERISQPELSVENDEMF